MRGAWFAIVVVLAVLAVVAVGGYAIYKYRLRVCLLIILLHVILLCAVTFCVLKVPFFLHVIFFVLSTLGFTVCLE